MAFKRETASVSTAGKLRIDEEIRNLLSSTLPYRDKAFYQWLTEKFVMGLQKRLLDKKRYLCGAKSKEFDLVEEIIQKVVKVENLQFGLSALHGCIKFFECLLHLSCKISLNKLQTRSENDKQTVNENRARISNEFRE